MAKTEFGKYIEEMYGDLEGFYSYFDDIEESLECIKDLQENIDNPDYDYSARECGKEQVYKTKEDYNREAKKEITAARADIYVCIECIKRDFNAFMEWNRCKQGFKQVKEK